MPRAFLITNKRYGSCCTWSTACEARKTASTERNHHHDQQQQSPAPPPMQQQSANLTAMTCSRDCIDDEIEVAVNDAESVESASEERVITDVDDVEMTPHWSPMMTNTSDSDRQREILASSRFTHADDYCKLDFDRPANYFSLPFQCQQRLATADERLLLPLVHSIILQRQQQQLQLQAASAAAVLSKPDRHSSLKLHSLDGVVVGAAQTSPAGPVGATVDASAAAALYHCTECGRAYSTASNLARHRQSHRSGAVSHPHHQRRTPSPDRRVDSVSRKCPHCDKVYASAPAYSMHVRTHSQGCECPQCGKRFSRPWLLQGHIRTHTGEKPFRCPHCGKTFADKSNLRAHIQTHSTDKPHVCGRCGKAFALRSYLYKHEESSCMRSHRLYRGYGYLHHEQQQQQLGRQRPLSPVIRTTSMSQIPCQL